MDLNIFWFILLGILLAGYAVLDGFDLGVGMLHPLGRSDTERRILLNSIGPIWDGNEVWLVTFGGAMLSAFPVAYATIFSGFYVAFMVVLFALIFRAVSIEFRSKFHSPRWRSVWDWGFCLSSYLASFTFGVAIGAAMDGIPLDQRGEFVGRFVDQIGFYPLLVGLLTVSMFLMHGAIYLYLKTSGPLQERIHGWMWRGFGLFLVMYMFTTIVTLITIPRATQNFQHHPWAWLVVFLNVLAIANIPRAIYRRRPGYAFASSSATIIALVVLFGVALFPNLVTSQPHPEYSLTIYNAASSQPTLRIMAFIAIIGMPFVLCYTVIVYRTFHGKVQLDKHAY